MELKDVIWVTGNLVEKPPEQEIVVPYFINTQDRMLIAAMQRTLVQHWDNYLLCPSLDNSLTVSGPPRGTLANDPRNTDNISEGHYRAIGCTQASADLAYDRMLNPIKYMRATGKGAVLIIWGSRIWCNGRAVIPPGGPSHPDHATNNATVAALRSRGVLFPSDLAGIAA